MSEFLHPEKILNVRGSEKCLKFPGWKRPETGGEPFTGR
jgi:hypothetical protein